VGISSLVSVILTDLHDILKIIDIYKTANLLTLCRTSCRADPSIAKPLRTYRNTGSTNSLINYLITVSLHGHLFSCCRVSVKKRWESTLTELFMNMASCATEKQMFYFERALEYPAGAQKLPTGFFRLFRKIVK
jgi:hypothetical protein